MKKALVALATLIHLLPHPFGVSTVGATALYAGAYGSKRTSWLVPIVPLTLGVLLTGLYAPTVMLLVFAGFSLSSFAGRWFLSRRRDGMRFALAIATGATIFFAVSNFAMWLAGYYPPTLDGLIQCYVNGLPYLAKALVADTIYCAVLFGLHTIIERYRSEPAVA